MRKLVSFVHVNILTDTNIIMESLRAPRNH